MTPRQKRAERRAQRKKERAERRRVANEKTAEKKRLALAQRAQNESESDAPVRSVLEELDWKYQENASQIIAMSDKGSEILAEAGLTESRTSIMEQVNKVMDKPLLDDNGNNNQKYAEYLALYITMRKGS
jgi:regulator of protease activity HflC (stomatin/prohibitin superfamily)